MFGPPALRVYLGPADRPLIGHEYCPKVQTLNGRMSGSSKWSTSAVATLESTRLFFCYRRAQTSWNLRGGKIKIKNHLRFGKVLRLYLDMCVSAPGARSICTRIAQPAAPWVMFLHAAIAANSDLRRASSSKETRYRYRCLCKLPGFLRWCGDGLPLPLLEVPDGPQSTATDCLFLYLEEPCRIVCGRVWTDWRCHGLAEDAQQRGAWL
jgi:hypothetical protein